MITSFEKFKKTTLSYDIVSDPGFKYNIELQDFYEDKIIQNNKDNKDNNEYIHNNDIDHSGIIDLKNKKNKK